MLKYSFDSKLKQAMQAFCIVFPFLLSPLLPLFFRLLPFLVSWIPHVIARLFSSAAISPFSHACMLAPCKHVKVGIKAIFKGLANKRRTMCEKRKEKKAKQKLGDVITNK